MGEEKGGISQRICMCWLYVGLAAALETFCAVAAHLASLFGNTTTAECGETSSQAASTASTATSGWLGLLGGILLLWVLHLWSEVSV